MSDSKPNNPVSAAWEQLRQLTDICGSELKKRYGFQLSETQPPSSPRELLFALRGYGLKLKLENSDITATIENDSVAGLPEPRIFRVQGTTDAPLLFELNTNPKEVSTVLGEISKWFCDSAK